MATVFGAESSKRPHRSGRTSRGTPARAIGSGRDLGRGAPSPLNSLIQEQIIPRLLMAHSTGMVRTRAPGVLSVDPADAARFSALPLDLEADELLDVVEGYITKGISVESVFVDLLAPSARRLGQFWEEDECDFLDVTMGLWRIQEVMRQIAVRHPPLGTGGPGMRSALFSPVPGDDHSLGALMIEEVFARHGWQTEALISPKRKELLQIIADRPFDVVGLTVSCDCPNGLLADLISAMRSVSRTPGVQVLIGGRMVNANPAIVEEVGADGTATDACGALALAETLVSRAAFSSDPLA